MNFFFLKFHMIKVVNNSDVNTLHSQNMMQEEINANTRDDQQNENENLENSGRYEQTMLDINDVVVIAPGKF